MGCNAIRTAHNPPAPEFVDLCDRKGFLVMDEAFDEWRVGKREHAYHKYFDQWGEKRLEFPRQGTFDGWNRYDRPRVNPTIGDLFLTWDGPYEPGVLKAVGKRSDEVVFTKEIRTTGKATDIRLSVDRHVIKADQRDVAQVTIEIVDAEGNVVPTADNRVKFTVEGEERLIGVDNGNPRDHNYYQIYERHAFNGLCLVIVQSAKKPGKIRFEARANGLKKAVIEFEARNN